MSILILLYFPRKVASEYPKPYGILKFHPTRLLRLVQPNLS